MAIVAATTNIISPLFIKILSYKKWNLAKNDSKQQDLNLRG